MISVVQLEKRKERAVCMLLCTHRLLLPSCCRPCLPGELTCWCSNRCCSRVSRITEPGCGRFQLCQGAVASKVNSFFPLYDWNEDNVRAP